jgi:DNA-binding IclR family transcriptional regulator
MKTHTKKKTYRRIVQTLQRKGQVNQPDGSWRPGNTSLTSNACMMAGSSHGK